MDRTHLFSSATKRCGGNVSAPDSRNILICGVNWLGDSCMSMPAIQAWKEKHTTHSIHLLIKPPLVPLWQCHTAIDHIITLVPGNAGPFKTGFHLRKTRFDTAYIFPNSWRSALPPWMANIPQRVGFSGHMRKWLLTESIPDAPETEHQQWEYARILNVPLTEPLPLPTLALPPPPAEMTDHAKPCIGLLPGAARGPSKRWPTHYFIAAAKELQKSENFHFFVMGTPAEATLCREITHALQPHAQCLAGNTTIPALAAGLRHCAGVLSNDSGGMHVAAAVGTPVVALFGLTNPSKTGPIGPYARCLQPAGVQGSRKITRDSAEAQRALASIPPQDAANALLDLMRTKAGATA